jgi:hypothetical protein
MTPLDKLTSVKVNSKKFEEFQVESIRMKFSLTKLVNRAMKLYMTDEEFKKKISDPTLDLDK